MTDPTPSAKPSWLLRRALRSATAETYDVLDGDKRVGTVSLQYAPDSVEGMLALPADTVPDDVHAVLGWLTEWLALDAAAGAGGVVHWVVSTGVVEDFYRRSPGRRPTGVETDLATARARVEAVLTAMFPTPTTLPDGGGYAVDTGSVRVFVAPRLGEGGAVLVRVFAITNLDVPLDGELPAYLLSLNFGLAFGRFSLDTEHRAVWCDHVLTSDDLDATTLGRTVAAIASTADHYDDEIKARFGGRTFREEGSPVEHVAEAGMAGGYL